MSYQELHEAAREAGISVRPDVSRVKLEYLLRLKAKEPADSGQQPADVENQPANTEV